MPKLPPAPPSCNLPDDLIYSIVNVSPAVAPANNLSAPSGAPSDRAPPSDFFHNITNHPMSSLASGTSCVSLPIYKLSRAILHPTEPPKLNKLTSDMGSMGPESTPNTLFLALSQPNHPFAAYLTDELPRLASKPLITSSAVTDKLEDIKCARCRHYAVSVWHKTMNAKTGLLSLDIDSHGNDSSLFDVESGHQTNVAYTIGGDRNSLDNCKHPIYVSNITLPAILSLPPYILSLSGIPATYRPESSHKSTLSDCVPVGVGSSSTAVRRSTMSWPTIPDAPTLPHPRPTSKDNFYLNLHFASLRKHNKALNDAASIVTGLYIDRILYGDLGGEEVVFQGMLKGSTVSAASYKVRERRGEESGTTGQSFCSEQLTRTRRQGRPCSSTSELGVHCEEARKLQRFEPTRARDRQHTARGRASEPEEKEPPLRSESPLFEQRAPLVRVCQ